MRSKLNVTMVLALFGLFSVATACGDDDTVPAGTSSGGSTAGSSGGLSSGGKATGGTATGGKAGSSSSNGGDPSGNGGNASGDGGDPSVLGGASTHGGQPSSNGGEVGSGGDPSGNGGAAAGAGGTGPVGCIEITPAQFTAAVSSSYTNYTAVFAPNVLAPEADSLRLSIQGPPDYDGGETGTFDLTENGDDNYATCTRCFFVIADPNGNRTVFFQSEGTLDIDAASTQLAGTIDATVTNLKLVEVTIAADYTSTPVPNGACLTVASANIVAEPPPCNGFQCKDGSCLNDPTWECDGTPDCDDDSDEAPIDLKCVVPNGWQCPEIYVGDGDCDCGCGAKDTDCAGTTDENECQYCSECTGNLLPCPDGSVEPADTTTCL